MKKLSALESTSVLYSIIISFEYFLYDKSILCVGIYRR